jgi:ribosomal protein S26
MNIRAVRQVLAPSQIHWVPTGLVIAVALTKHDVKLQNSLRMWCSLPIVQLREEKNRKQSHDFSQKTNTSEKH